MGTTTQKDRNRVLKIVSSSEIFNVKMEEPSFYAEQIGTQNSKVPISLNVEIYNTNCSQVVF